MQRALTRVIAGALFAAFLLMPSPATADPIVIVDTGQPEDTFYRLVLNQDQWLAGEFSVGSPVTVTEVRGFITSSHIDTALWVKLYQDGGEIPGAELFTAGFWIQAVGTNWRGVAGLDWFLDPGTYWVAFGSSSETGTGTGMAFPSPSPLTNTAVYQPKIGHWTGTDSDDVGIRIFGEQTAVPEPSSLLLFATGVLAFIARRRRLQ